MATKRKKKGDKHYVNNKEFTASIISDKGRDELSKLSITDATACIGGNTISFGKLPVSKFGS
jgi:hypothetical protein